MSDLEAKIDAKNKLREVELAADLKSTQEDFAKLFILKAPEIKEITTEAELETLIAAIKNGTAKNEQLTKFVTIANKFLKKI
jgi:hypothetical protein